jgi:hypothetical protein
MLTRKIHAVLESTNFETGSLPWPARQKLTSESLIPPSQSVIDPAIGSR